MSSINRIMHKIIQHIICPRVGLTDDVTKLERFYLYHMITKTKASPPSLVKYHMIQCRLKGTKISYGMLFTEIFHFYKISIAASDGYPPRSEITITNIKQMKIKIKSSELISSIQQPQKDESKAQELPIKRQRDVLSDSSDEDTIPLTIVLKKDRRTKKRQDPKPLQKKSKPFGQAAQPLTHISQPYDSTLTPTEMHKKKLEEEGLEDEETINILKAFKNDLMIRSPDWTALKNVPLRLFTFFLEQSQKIKPTKSSCLSQADAKAYDALIEAARRADEKA